MIAAVSNGQIVQWASLATLAFTLWRITRGGGGSAVQELTAANKVLERRNVELGAEVRDLRVKVAHLEERTDFSKVMDRHEKAAQQRAAGILNALDLIADRLGAQQPEAAP